MRLGALQISLPADWEDHSLYSFVAPAQPTLPMRPSNPGFQENLVVQPRKLDTGEDLLRCTQRLLDNTQREMDVANLEQGSLRTNSGLDVERVSYTLVDPYNQMPVAQVVYLLVHEQTEWQFAFSVSAIQLEARRPAFDAWVGSAAFPSD